MKKDTVALLSTPWQLRIIVGIGIFIYLNTLGHGFVLDDQAVITGNKFVKEGFSGWGNILTTFYWKGYNEINSGLFRPLSLLLFSVEWSIAPGKPFFFHLVHLIFFMLLLIVLYHWLHRLFEKQYPMLSFYALLLFALHPVHTEVIANIKSSDEVLSLLFGSACALYLLKKEGKRLVNEALSAFLFLLALLSKESAVLFIPLFMGMLLFLEYSSWNILVRRMMPLIVVTLLWLVWRNWVIYHLNTPLLNYTYEDNALVAAPSMGSRLATAVSLLGRYVFLLFYPFSLSYDYSFYQIPYVSWISAPFIATVFLILFSGILFFRCLRSCPIISWSLLFFYTTLLLTSNIFFLIGATFAERFLFTPSFGFCILVGYAIQQGMQQERFRKILGSGVMILALILGITTFQRNKNWKSNLTLFSSDVHHAPGSARVHYNYATVLLNEEIPHIKEDRKKIETYHTIVDELSQSISIDSMHAASYINLGVAYFKLKDYRSALQVQRKALALHPSDSSFLTNLGDTYFMLGNYDSSIAFYERSIAAGVITDNTYNFLGTAWFNKKEYNQAVKAFEVGVNLRPDDAALWLNYANAQAAEGNFKESLISFERAFQLDPGNDSIPYYMGFTYYQMGDFVNAQKWDKEFKRRKGVSN